MSATEPLISGYELSDHQEQLWTRTPCETQRVCAAMLLPKSTTDDQVREALIAIASRHEILRTSFEASPGLRDAVQVVHETATVGWRTELEPPVAIKQALRAAQIAELDYAGGSPLRAALRSKVGGGLILSLALPALCGDEESLELILEHLTESDVTNSPSQHILQYADYAGWRNDVIARDPAGPPIDVVLMRDQAKYGLLRPPRDCNTRDVKVESVPIPTSPELTTTVILAATRLDVAVEALLLTTWCDLVFRVSGHDRLIVGVRHDGRDDPDLAQALGPYARLLPVEVSLAPGRPPDKARPIAERLAALPSVSQRFSWASIQSKGELPSFPVAFAFRERSLTGVQMIEVADPFALRLCCESVADGLTLRLDFDSGEVESATAEGLARMYTELLRKAGHETPPISQAARTSASGRPCEQSRGVRHTSDPAHVLFHNQARLSPAAPAVVTDSECVSYAELRRRAGHFAAKLREQDIGRESIVGVLFDRSIEMAVAILGILEAGAAFLPLDPNQPATALHRLLADSRPAIVAASEHHMAVLPSDVPAIATTCDQGYLPTASAPVWSDLAYVVYTSGSSGAAKGVVIDHYSLAHYLAAIRERLDVGDADRYLWTAAPGFSSTVRQLLLPLTSGAAVVIATRTQMMPTDLLDLVRAQNVTVVDFVPSYWRSFVRTLRDVDESELRRLASTKLRLLLSASEPLHTDLARQLRDISPASARVVNMYGQTETTGIVATYEFDTNDAPEPVVPLGRALARTTLLILDDDLRSVPRGIVGELCVAGPGLAQGYLGGASTTDEVFSVVNIDGHRTRICRTGDLGCERSDGTIAYAGRKDELVKVRGFRVALSSVENELQRHAAVEQAVVVVCPDATGESALTAYVVPRRDQRPTRTDLAKLLEERLPSYMIPSTFVLMKELPIGVNGKVDRRALPQPDGRTDLVHDQYVPPHTDAERALALIWGELFSTETIGGNDNFLDLGGHSLLGINLLARIQATFGVKLALQTIFEVPILSELAARVVEARTAESLD
jgi:amino acid adenylation domain-containing protein